MLEQFHWTPALDDRLVALRTAGLTWELIGRELDIGRVRVRERARRLGAYQLPRRREVSLEVSQDRPPWPPGHPECWGLITAGTVLEGEPYPLPVFL